ncbi:MAG: hypothetical protein ABSB69_10020 [Solirubrobacteraceae bacterium]
MWATGLALKDIPDATDRLHGEAVFQRHGDGTEAVAKITAEAYRRLRVAMPLAAFTRLERFNASFTQCVHVWRDAGVKLRETPRSPRLMREISHVETCPLY